MAAVSSNTDIQLTLAGQQYMQQKQAAEKDSRGPRKRDETTSDDNNDYGDECSLL
jgi:hypothetical protein